MSLITIKELHLHFDSVESVLSKLSIIESQGATIMAELVEVKASLEALNISIAAEHDQVSEVVVQLGILSEKVVELQAIIDGGGAATASDLADLKDQIDAARAQVANILPDTAP